MRGTGLGKEKTVVNTTFNNYSLGPQRSIMKEAGGGAAQERRQAGPRAWSFPDSFLGPVSRSPAICWGILNEGSIRCLCTEVDNFLLV